MPEFKYDLFISYSHQDAAWARKLYDDLVASGLDPNSIFFDQERIDPGVLWRPALDDAIQSSRQLALLWSDNVRQSDWVPQEAIKFTVTLKPDASGQFPDGRRFLFIPLQGDNNVYRQYQVIEDITRADAYSRGAGGIDPNLWTGVVEQVVKSVTANSDFKPIKLTVLAMTRDRINSLKLGSELPDGSKLADAVRRMGIKMDIELLDHLDPTLTLPNGQTLAAALAALGIQTEPAPDDPDEIRIVVDGQPLGQTLKHFGLKSMDKLLKWVDENPGFVLPGGQPLGVILATTVLTIRPNLENLMIKIALRQYYGTVPLDWRPFGSPDYKIATIMAKVKSEFNRRLLKRRLADKRFRWELAGDFWSETPQAEDERDWLSSKRTVIVVDPLSLYDEAVAYRRFKQLYGAFQNENALIMAFAPFALPTPTGVMRTLINDRAVQMFRSFYQPRIVAESSLAKCGPDVGDEVDIGRWLLTALWPQADAVVNRTKVAASQEADAFMGR